MKTGYRYCMRTAADHGEIRHPQLVIREHFPEATDFEPVSIADCWMFNAEPRECPALYFVALGEVWVPS